MSDVLHQMLTNEYLQNMAKGNKRCYSQDKKSGL
jgi:hypothetical protein